MSTQTTLPQPTTRSSKLSETDYKWLLLVQTLLPLVVINTSGGNIVQAVPNAGIGASGQTAQNQEITYVKSSSDGNSFTLTGVQGGNIVISAQYAFFKIKSDGTNWWRVG